ncbi:MAG TPA: protein kinase [Blastocatellia bacterium]|nr:protein kinase [Blastocatellia bacterium]
MTPERWEQVEEIFNTALDHPADEREAFLTNACGDDLALRHQIEYLINCHEQAGDFIEDPAAVRIEDPAAVRDSSLPDGAVTPQPDAMVGRQIGAYRLVREIGRGGMGAVYLAVRSDDQYQKRVALKLVRRGMDTKDILRRFRHERQILAGLNHPYIAQMLDGGTTEDGLPYFAMEYVEGQPITRYCDKHKLAIAERLKLFRQICSAASYAHQNLVVHRDLKPSNILITVDGTPKLLDFGIAKLLNPELSAQTIDPTATALRMMTPEYASPEQVLGEPVTTASDVYSLGVVLYELLTGHRPYRLKSRLPHEILRIVCEEEPERPSAVINRVQTITGAEGATQVSLTPEIVSRTREGAPEKLRRRLRGDLDNIILMAMRKEPQRRYDTVNQLSEDIRRHLEGLPVVARKATFGYRVEKFIARHKTSVATAVVVVASLLAGVMTTVWQSLVARDQRARAERRFEEGRKLANLLIYKLHDEVGKLAGSTPARELMVKGALDYLDGVNPEAGDNPSLQLELAEAYLKIGDVQGNPNNANLGNTGGALQSYNKAKTIAETLLRRNPEDAKFRRVLAISCNKTGDMMAVTGNPAEAIKSQLQALPIFEALAKPNPADGQAQINLARCYLRLGDNLGNPNFPNLGDTNQALDYFRKSMAVVEALAAHDPKHAQARRYIYLGHERIADALDFAGDAAGALEHYKHSQSIAETLIAADPSNGDYRRHLAVIFDKTGIILVKIGDAAGALEVSRKALNIFEALSAVDPTNTQAPRDLAISYKLRGDHLSQIRDTAVALAYYRKGLAIFETLGAADPMNRYLQSDMAETMLPLAKLLAQTGQIAEARRLSLRALSIKKAHAEQPEATANDLNFYAWALLTAEPSDLRDPADALAHARRAVDMTKGNAPNILNTLAMAYHLTGDYARAVETEQKAISLLKADSPARREFETDLARYRRQLAGEADGRGKR